MRFKIIHTNDLHSHLEHWPVLVTYIDEQQTLAKEKNEILLTLDIGDAMDSFHPYVEATYGKIIVDLLNDAQYDIVTMGNNEGLNFSKKRIIELYERAEFDITIANLLDADTQQIPSYAEEIIYREVHGLKIAFLGLTEPYETYKLNGYKILDPLNTLQQQLEYLREHQQPDLIVLLSHLGIVVDRYIASLYPEVNLIIGAHTHHLLPRGDWENQTFICAAGKYGHYIGSIDLFYSEHTQDWHMEAEVFSLEELSNKFNMPAIINDFQIKGRHELDKRHVAYLPFSFYYRELEGKHSFIQLALNALTQATGIPNAILNSGLFLKDLSEGLVTENDLHEALPHPMHLCIITMTGSQLLELFNQMAFQSQELQYKSISGYGFRGKVFGDIVMKGFEYNIDKKEWLADGKLIQLDAVYDFVTVDHLWFLPYFPDLERYGNPRILFPDFIRHVVRNYLEQLYPIESS